MIAQKPSISKLTAQLGAGAAGAAEGSREGLTLQEIRLGAAASAPWKPAGPLSALIFTPSLHPPTAVDSFDYKKFFQMVGLKKKSPDDVKKVFHILDKDKNGFIDEKELGSIDEV
eukprot:bmy_01166T0